MGISEIYSVLYALACVAALLGAVGVIARMRVCRWLSTLLLLLVCPCFLAMAGVWYVRTPWH